MSVRGRGGSQAATGTKGAGAAQADRRTSSAPSRPVAQPSEEKDDPRRLVFLMRARLIQALERAFAGAPAAKSPEFFDQGELGVKYAELVHEAIAQAQSNTMGHALTDFDQLCRDGDLAKRLAALEQASFQPPGEQAPSEVVGAHDQLMAAKERELQRLEDMVAAAQQLQRVAEAELAEEERAGEAIRETLSSRAGLAKEAVDKLTQAMAKFEGK